MNGLAMWQQIVVLIGAIGVLSWTCAKGIVERTTLSANAQTWIVLLVGIMLGELAHAFDILQPSGPDPVHYVWAGLIGLLGGMVGLSGTSSDVSKLVVGPSKPSA